MRQNPIRVIAAVALVAAALSACQRRFASLYAEGKTAFAADNFVESADAMNMALRQWKESDGTEIKAQALQILGHSYHRLKKMEKAIDVYQEAVRLSSNTYPAAYQLGIVLLSRNEPDLARK